MSDPQDRLFKPSITVSIEASFEASTSVALPSARSGSVARVAVVGTGTAYIEFGDSTVTASLSSSMPVFPGSELFDIKDSIAYVAAVSDVPGTKVYITIGEGEK